eukprot:scaffold6807_cov78-Skeletonema_marinoi.AAC.1
MRKDTTYDKTQPTYTVDYFESNTPISTEGSITTNIAHNNATILTPLIKFNISPKPCLDIFIQGVIPKSIYQ